MKNYVITPRGQQADPGELRPNDALSLQAFREDATGNVTTISQFTGLSHSESMSSIGRLLKAGLIAPEESERSFLSKMLRRR